MSPGVSLAEVAISLALFTVVYGVLAVAEIVLLVRHVKAGPDEPVPAVVAGETERRVPTMMY